MNLALTAFTARGARLAEALTAALEGEGHTCTLAVPARLAPETGHPGYESLGRWTGEQFARCGALIFVGASGIAVRAIAPYVKDKFTDPAVVSVDEGGRFVVPLLSGHVGGANELARKLADLTGGQAAVSTATDVSGLFAVDEWAARRGMAIADRALAKAVSAALLAGQPVGFASDFGHPVPPGLTGEKAPLGVWVTCRTGPCPYPATLRLVPRCLTVGIGCRRGSGEEAIAAAVDAALAGLDRAGVCGVATIDLKGDEPGLLAFCARQGWPLRTFAAEELARAPGEFAHSDFVAKVTGVGNVCERAAVLAGGALLVPRLALDGVTAAVACRAPSPLEEYPRPAGSTVTGGMV